MRNPVWASRAQGDLQPSARQRSPGRRNRSPHSLCPPQLHKSMPNATVGWREGTLGRHECGSMASASWAQTSHTWIHATFGHGDAARRRGDALRQQLSRQPIRPASGGWQSSRRNRPRDQLGTTQRVAALLEPKSNISQRQPPQEHHLSAGGRPCICPLRPRFDRAATAALFLAAKALPKNKQGVIAGIQIIYTRQNGGQSVDITTIYTHITH